MLTRFLIVLTLSSLGYCQQTIAHTLGAGNIGGGPCGKFDSATNSTIVTPPNYKSFAAPASGVTIVDQEYGCASKRLADGRTLGLGSGLVHEYAPVKAMNFDDTLMLLQTVSGNWCLASGPLGADPSGTIEKSCGSMEFSGTAAYPRWGRTSATARTFYYDLSGKILKKAVVGAAPTYTLTLSVQHDFTATCSSMNSGGSGEGDVSIDGDHLPIVCDNKIMLYTISTDTVGPSVDFTSVGNTFNFVTLFPDNKIGIGWNGGYVTGRYHGIELYDANMNFVMQIARNASHHDQGKDPNGNNGIFISAQDVLPDSTANPCGSSSAGQAFVKESDGTYVCVLNTTNFSYGFHFSYSPSGFILSEFDDYKLDGTSTQLPNAGLPTNWASLWTAYDNELVIIDIRPGQTWPPTAKQVRRLLHLRNHPFVNSTTADYWADPRPSLSMDGCYVLFDAWMDNTAYTGSLGGDVFLVKVC